MYFSINDIYYFHHTKNNVELTDPFIINYTKYLKEHKGSSSKTIRIHVTSIHKFWLYAMYMPPRVTDDLRNYIIKYRDTLLQGFEINEKITDTISGISLNITTNTFKKLHSASMDMRILKEYYTYLIDPLLNPLVDKLDAVASMMYFTKDDETPLIAKEKYSPAAIGYGLKARGIKRVALMEKQTIFTALSTSKRNRNNNPSDIRELYKAIPIRGFEIMLERAKDNPRKRLLYLLCAGTSARIGQALNLTKWDVHLSKALKDCHTFLIDPLSKDIPILPNGKALFEQGPRIDMLLAHGVNPRVKPHSLITFKGEAIPSKKTTQRSLYFFSERYEQMFYDTYVEVRSLSDKNSPFIFQTSTGKRWKTSGAQKEIARDIKWIKDNHPEIDMPKTKAFHGLRHLYGRSMADIAYYISSKVQNGGFLYGPNNEVLNIVEVWREATATFMGHKSMSAVDVYFNVSEYVKGFAMDLVKQNKKELEQMRSRMIAKSNILVTQEIKNG